MIQQQMQQWESQGITLQVEGQELIVQAPSGVLTPDITDQIKAAKRELLELLTPKQPNDWHDRFEERAGSLEYDAPLPRHEAEQRARREVFFDYAQCYYPLVIQAFEGAIAERVH